MSLPERSLIRDYVENQPYLWRFPGSQWLTFGEIPIPGPGLYLNDSLLYLNIQGTIFVS